MSFLLCPQKYSTHIFSLVDSFADGLLGLIVPMCVLVSCVSVDSLCMCTCIFHYAFAGRDIHGHSVGCDASGRVLYVQH